MIVILLMISINFFTNCETIKNILNDQTNDKTNNCKIVYGTYTGTLAILKNKVGYALYTMKRYLDFKTVNIIGSFQGWKEPGVPMIKYKNKVWYFILRFSKTANCQSFIPDLTGDKYMVFSEGNENCKYLEDYKLEILKEYHFIGKDVEINDVTFDKVNDGPVLIYNSKKYDSDN